MPIVLVTGANGFIGRPLCNTLAKNGCDVKGVIRSSSKSQGFHERIEPVVGDIVASQSNDWRQWLNGVGTVIHLAAYVHRPAGDAEREKYQQVNSEGTFRLCRLAVECGVRRIVFLSSLKVNGETSGLPLSEKDAADPQDPYARSKWEAEKQIQRITRGSHTDFVIIRPPLVYGPRVRANFLSLLKVVSANIPLPLGSLHNRRSMIYVGNLADAVVSAVESPRAGGQVFMVSDGQDLTVTGMVKELAVAMGQKPRLFPFPVGWLRGPLAMIGRGEVIDKLSRPLTVDASKIRDTLGWRPPFSVQEGLAATAAWFKKRYPQKMPALK